MKNKYFVLAIIISTLFACTTDREFEIVTIASPEDPSFEFIHY